VGEEGFSFDVPLSFSAYNMLNFDIGHYVAGTNASPIPIIEKYHDRISHLHIKDRKKDNGDNVPWGEGDTPIGEVLRLLQKKQSPITAMIELEYDIPEGSDVLTEMAKCVNFCREALS
jgi:sugar phosphate isomerase/epimerase